MSKFSLETCLPALERFHLCRKPVCIGDLENGPSKKILSQDHYTQLRQSSLFVVKPAPRTSMEKSYNKYRLATKWFFVIMADLRPANALEVFNCMFFACTKSKLAAIGAKGISPQRWLNHPVDKLL